MKANELMIGDWIYSDGKATYITQVNSDNEVWTNKNPFLPNDNIEPIPLTEEILKANFKQSDRDDIFYSHRVKIHFWEKDNVTFEIRTADLADVCIDYYCKYVHELQHALRLCGLTKLADNFKIE